VGLAYVDLLTFTIGVCQFNDFAETLANSEAALLQLGVKECVALRNNPQMVMMLARCDVALSQRSQVTAMFFSFLFAYSFSRAISKEDRSC
jgi:hypothetical protein